MAAKKRQVQYRRPQGTGDVAIGRYVREHYPTIAHEAEEAGRRAAKARGLRMQAGLKEYRVVRTEQKIEALQRRLEELKNSHPAVQSA
jgi:hypothetical protein